MHVYIRKGWVRRVADFDRSVGADGFGSRAGGAGGGMLAASADGDAGSALPYPAADRDARSADSNAGAGADGDA